MVVVAVHQTKGLPNIVILHAFKDLQFKDWQVIVSQKAESILAPVCMMPKLGFFQMGSEGLSSAL